MRNQQTKLQRLVRRNKGRTQHPYYAVELSHRLKSAFRPSDVLDLEETDRIVSINREQSARSYKTDGFALRKIWKRRPASRWSESCRRFGEKLQGQTVVLFVGPYEYCGAVRASADVVLNDVASLLEFDGNTVSVQSASSESGLLIDLHEKGSEWMVELVAWGEWKTLAAESVS